MKKRINKGFIKNLTDQIFGRLTIIKFAYTKNHKAYWLVRCTCGNEKIALGESLKNGHTQSCGCLRLESVTKHGQHTPKNRKNGYTSWIAMKTRCLNPKYDSYKNYGGRGITIDPRWLDKEHGFENFFVDMGPRPSLDHSLDRVDVDGNYCKSNCRWATWEEQGLAKRTTPHSKNLIEHKKWKTKLYGILNKFMESRRFGFIRDTPLFIEHIGISFPNFRMHIESLWTIGMNWNNYGSGFGKWQFDHIQPCNTFDLSNEKDRKVCFHFSNIQPMWFEDHRKKSKRVNDYVLI